MSISINTPCSITSLNRLLPEIRSAILQQMGLDPLTASDAVLITAFDPSNATSRFELGARTNVNESGSHTFYIRTAKPRHVEVSSDQHILVADVHNASLVSHPAPLAKGFLTPIVRRPRHPEFVLSQIPIPRRTHAGNRAKILKAQATADFGFGRFIGLFVSDGWADGSAVHLAKECVEIQESFYHEVSRLFMAGPPTSRLGEAPHNDPSLGLNALSTKMSVSSSALSDLLRGWIGHRAANKCLPTFFPFLPEDCLWGMLSGLLDGDGSVSHRQRDGRIIGLNCNFTTISSRLVQDIVHLARLLGVRCTATKCTKCSVLSFSIVDVLRNRDRILLLQPNKRDALANAREVTKDDEDIVPFPLLAAESIIKLSNLKLLKEAQPELFNRRKRGYVRRDIARRHLEQLRTHSALDERLSDWVRLVEDTSLSWDKIEEVSSGTVGPTQEAKTSTGFLVMPDGLILDMTRNTRSIDDRSACSDS